MGMEPPFLVTPVAMVAFLPRLGTVLVSSTGQFGGVKLGFVFKGKPSTGSPDLLTIYVLPNIS